MPTKRFLAAEAEVQQDISNLQVLASGDRNY